MFCGKCGNKIDGGRCPNCDNLNNQLVDTAIKTENNKKIFLFCSIIALFLIVVVLFFVLNSKNQRSETLTNLEKSDYLKFSLDGNTFYLGDKVSDYRLKKYSYDETYLSEDAHVASDSIISQTFYNEQEDAQFLGALYCKEGSNCSYEDTVIVKINFYEESDVIVNDYIKFGMKYDDIVKKYGKEDGQFYQDSELLVWTFGEKGKIGEPYYILRFDNSGWFSTGKLIEIRIGVWWYEGEYEHTVIKEVEEGNTK